MTTSSEKTTASLIHLSTLSQFCIPFGNYIFPILIWSAKKKDSEFVDFHGKQALNFQLSILLYSFILFLIAVPLCIFTILNHISLNEIAHNQDIIFENCCHGNISGSIVLLIVAILVFIFLKIMEFILIIYAAVKASNGENYKYPLSISFLK